MKERTQKSNTFFGGAAILAVSIAIVKIIGALYKIPLGRILGDVGFGHFNNAYAIYNLLLMISTAGLPVAMSKTISEANALDRRNQVNRVFRVALVTFVILGSISSLVMFVFAQPLANLQGDSLAAPAVRVMALSCFFVCTMSAYRGYAQGHSDMVPTAVSQVLEALTKLGVGLVLAWYILYLGFGSEFSAAGAIGGGLWALVPAFFKARWGTNETLFTLMMNYVAIQLTSYFVALWENPVGSNTVGVINQRTKDGWFPELFGQEYGLNVVLVLLLTVGMFLYLKYSKQGYEISVVGDSENTARYAGINVKKVTIRTMAISGAICGLAGFIAVAGASHTISTSTAGGRGFTAIIVAWLAQFNTFVMILISFLLVFLQKGAIQIASQFNLNDYASNIITGIILFFILGSEFFINYRIILRGGKEGAK